jgi:hypothetical protein
MAKAADYPGQAHHAGGWRRCRQEGGEMALVGKLGFEPVDAGLLKNRCAVLMGLPTGPL